MQQLPVQPQPEQTQAPPSPHIVYDSRWQRHVFRPLLIAAISTSLAIGPLTVARYIFDQQRLLGLIPFFFLVALQAVYTRQWLADPKYRWFRDARTRLGEIALILIVLRLLIWLMERQRIDLETLQRWLVEPAAFFDLLFVSAVIITLITWSFAARQADTFLALGLTADELLEYNVRGMERSWVQALPRDRQELLRDQGEAWMWGGIILTLTAAASRIDFNPQPGAFIGLRTLGLPSELVLALVVYFLGGLLLISQGRLALLRARWQRERTPGIDQVTRTWQRHALFVILGVGLVASLLPFGSSFGLALILQAVIQVIALAAFAIFALIVSLLTLLMSLFRVEEILEEPEVLQATPVPFVEPEPPLDLAPLFPEWAGGAVFWIVALGLLLYLTLLFLRLQAAHGLGQTWLGRLLDWWRVVRGHARAVLQATRQRLRLPAAPGASVPQIAWRLVRLRGLSATERTRYFYLSILRRAGRAGLARAASQTPLEYEQTFAASLPAGDAEMRDLTGSFLQARYGAQPLSEEQAGQARQAWTALKRRLQRRRTEDRAS